MVEVLAISRHLDKNTDEVIVQFSSKYNLIMSNNEWRRVKRWCRDKTDNKGVPAVIWEIVNNVERRQLDANEHLSALYHTVLYWDEHEKGT